MTRVRRTDVSFSVYLVTASRPPRHSMTSVPGGSVPSWVTTVSPPVAAPEPRTLLRGPRRQAAWWKPVLTVVASASVLFVVVLWALGGGIGDLRGLSAAWWAGWGG